MQGGRGRGNCDEAGGGDELSGIDGIDPLCAHCAEKQKDLFQPHIHGNRLWSSLIAYPTSTALLKMIHTGSVSGQNLTIRTPAMVSPSVRGS